MADSSFISSCSSTWITAGGLSTLDTWSLSRALHWHTDISSVAEVLNIYDVKIRLKKKQKRLRHSVLWYEGLLSCLTLLSGDACTRELWWFPLLSFFSGVHTPGSVCVELSDSAESPPLFFQREVSWLFSVSLLWGKTKVSSSEPGGMGDNKTSVCWDQGRFIGREFVFCMWWRKDVLQPLPFVLDSGAGVHGQDPVVFLCFFKHSILTRSLQCLWQFIPQSERQSTRWDVKRSTAA